MQRTDTLKPGNIYGLVESENPRPTTMSCPPPCGRTEPEEAETYWNANIASLPAQRRKEVESYLPSISGDSRLTP